MPSHAIATKLGMMRDCFNFIWQHFHVQSGTDHYQSGIHESDYDAEKEEEEEEEVCEQTMERVQRDEEDMHGDNLSGVMSDSEDDEGSHDIQPAEDSDEHPRKKDV
eukprot:3838062-Ditylum_brightwellii.AAC.1